MKKQTKVPICSMALDEATALHAECDGKPRTMDAWRTGRERVISKFLRKILLFTSVFAFVVGGCAHIDTRDLIPLGEGMNTFAHMNFDSLAKGVADSGASVMIHVLTDIVSSPKFSASLQRFARTFLVSLQDSMVDPQSRKILGSAVTELLDTLNSSHNQHSIGVLVSNLGNLVLDKLHEPARERQFSELINKYLLGDSTTKSLLHLRDTMLGGQFGLLLKQLAGQVMDTLAYGMKHQLTPAMDSVVKSAEKSSSGPILIVMGIFSLLLIALGAVLYILKRRYQKMTELLTQEIDKISDQNVSDDLVTRIHEKAIEHKLEPHLQKVLQKQGLSTKENWHLKPKFSSAPFSGTSLSVKPVGENGHSKVS